MTSEFPAERLDELRELHRQLWSHHAELPRPPGFRVRPAADTWRAWLDRAQRLVASGEGVVLVDDVASPAGLALVCLLPPAEVARPVLTATGPHGELVSLVVDSASRSTGVGAELLAASVDWCRSRGAVAMHIEVRGSNIDAHRFYQRHDAVDGYLTMIVATGDSSDGPASAGSR